MYSDIDTSINFCLCIHTCTEFDMPDGSQCEESDVDTRWKIVWDATDLGTSDSQPCPMANAVESEGFAFRRCGRDGTMKC